MRYTRGALIRIVVICLVCLSLAGVASAEIAVGDQKEKPVIYLWSKTDISSVKDGELAGVYREADAELIEQVKEGLGKRGLRVTVIRADREIGSEPARSILLVNVNKVELGGKRPFGRTAKVKVAYALQDKDRLDLIKRTHEETSVQKWQNCVKKISEQLVADVTDDIARNFGPPKAEEKQATPKQDPPPAAAPSSGPSAATRLHQLESLKDKGLVTQEEYLTKRKEILKEL